MGLHHAAHSPAAGQRASNIACAVLGFFPFICLVVHCEQLIYRAIIPEPWDLVMALSEVLLVLGVIFRLKGPIMPIFVMVFLMYNMYGDYIPGFFANPGFGIDMLLGKMYCETEAGIFGTITGVSLKYLIYFTTHGAFISKLDFGNFIAYITSPVMGSISFLMVELLSIPYSWIIAMATGPMLLYLFGIAFYNELCVRKKRLPQMELDSSHDFSYSRVLSA